MVAIVLHPERVGAAPEQPYASSPRIEYIREAFAALDASSDATLARMHKRVYAVDRGQCQAPLQSLKVGCLLEASRQTCEQQPPEARDACNRIADILVTNRLSEPAFISRDTRFKLMSRPGDYRRVLFGELRRRYATLVVELTMSREFPAAPRDRPALARAVDSYCRSVSTTRELAWHHCTAAVVWFVGSSGRALEDKR